MFLKTLSTAAVVATVALTPAFAQSVAKVKPASEVGGRNLGTLACSVEGGWGLLLGSSKKATCVFDKTDGSTEAYTGNLNKIGIDIGKTKDAQMSWVVFVADNVEIGPNALAGSYTGVSGEVNLGIGLGANSLIGGNDKKIGLQPALKTGNEGSVNLAVGLASLSLDAAAQ